MRNIIEDFGITVYDRVLLFDGRKARLWCIYYAPIAHPTYHPQGS